MSIEQGWLIVIEWDMGVMIVGKSVSPVNMPLNYNDTPLLNSHVMEVVT